MEGWLKVESLACIDSNTLSHSELLALSLCTFHQPSTHAILTPNIDPALFNESAGSRRQTYSSPTGRRRRLAGLLPGHGHGHDSHPHPHPDPDPDPENRLIIDYLKQLIRDDPKFDQVQLAPPSLPRSNIKRKRGRKPRPKPNPNPVDLSHLANSQDPFAEELKRRTHGLLNEDDLLGFLRDLPGQWGSRRKKRRIVDASHFGHIFPLGWKLLLGLKRKDGRASIYCRRYISPSGQHFLSSKDVSSYLQPHSPTTDNVVPEHMLPAQTSAGLTQEHQDERQIVPFNSAASGISAANQRVKEVALLGIENLADVQIHDLFECRKCNMSFDEKDLYLQHLLSFHQRTTRRYRLGSSVGDGVIIKDGKFECQFCHKVFLERRRYNGHVGIHVRNYVQRRVEDLPAQANAQTTDDKSPVREDVPLRISKMDALIEIAQNSIMEDSVAEPLTSSKLNRRIPASDIAVGYLDQDRNSGSPVSEQKMEDGMTGKNVDHELDGKVEERDNDNNVIDVKMVTFLDNVGLLSVDKQDVNASETYKLKDDVPLTIEELDQSGMDLDGISQNRLLPLSEHPIIPESEKNENSGYANSKGQFKLDEGISDTSEFEFGLNGLKDVPVTVITNVQDMVMPASEENVGGKQFCSVYHEHDNVKGFQELRFDDMDTVDYDFARVQDSPPLPDVPTELANNTVMEGTYASSVQFESQEVTPGKNQLTTVCVWCGIEFNHDAGDSEIQPDSVGFMCPACKAKISGQINVLDCGLPNADCL